MKQSWLAYHFGWIRDDLKHMLAALRKLETWITIGMVGGFGLIAWGILRLALQSDNTLRSLRPAMAFCREQENAAILFIFFCGVFFVLSAFATVGEFFNYLEAKRHKSFATARRSLLTTALTGTIALVLGFAILLFLEGRCL